MSDNKEKAADLRRIADELDPPANDSVAAALARIESIIKTLADKDAEIAVLRGKLELEKSQRQTEWIQKIQPLPVPGHPYPWSATDHGGMCACPKCVGACSGVSIGTVTRMT